MTEPIKLCKDCRYCEMTWHTIFDENLVRCWHPLVVETSPISGRKIPRFASVQREFSYLCGPNARNFEPELTFWQRITGKGAGQ